MHCLGLLKTGTHKVCVFVYLLLQHHRQVFFSGLVQTLTLF